MFIGRLDTVEEAMGVENLIHLALPEENDLKMYNLFLDRHPQRNNMERIIAVEDGIVVAHALLIPQTLVLEGSAIETDKVGFVATHPAYRNRGIMAALMKKAMGYIADRGKPLSIVYGIPYFYRKFGYEYAIPDDTFGPYTTVPVDDSEKPFSVRPAKPSDVEKMMKMYEKSNKNTLFAQRTRADWLFQEAMISTFKDVKSIVFMDGSRIKGYARVHNGGIVREMAVEGLSNKNNVKNYLAALGKLGKTEEIKLGLPPRHPFVEASTSLGGKKPGRSYGGYMHITSLTKLLFAIKKPLESRLKDADEDFKGRILLDIYEQSTTLNISSGKIISLEDGIKGAPDMHIRLPPGIMMQLITGYKEVMDIADICDVMATNEGLVLLGNMFPKGAPYLDYFDR